MKYCEGDILYYVNPFVFIIEKVKIEMGILEDGELFYIDDTGAYLKEEELFKNFKEAQRCALEHLEKFSTECKWHILNDRPQLFEGDNGLYY